MYTDMMDNIFFEVISGHRVQTCLQHWESRETLIGWLLVSHHGLFASVSDSESLINTKQMHIAAGSFMCALYGIQTNTGPMNYLNLNLNWLK